MKKVITLCFALIAVGVLAIAQYAPPSGGWDYIYNGDVADTLGDLALDMTFENPGVGTSFNWDLTGPGEGAPGGAAVVTEEGATFLRIQDAGDPSDHGRENPENGNDNGKVAFIHYVGTTAGYDSNALILDDGLTIAWRARVPTTGLDSIFVNGGTEVLPYPAAGDGYFNDNGVGQFNFSQVSADGVKRQLAFTFMTTFDDDTITTLGTGLYMNLLNGNDPDLAAGKVGPPDDLNEPGVTLNRIELDPTVWHEFWMQVSTGTVGSHQVKIWMDGEVVTSKTFQVTAGTSTFRPYSCFWMGHKNTNESGAIDFDYFAYKSGIHDPVSAVGINDVKSSIFQLRNYPNPLYGTTTIEFKIESSGFATLKIYNPVGQLVKTVMAKELASGSYSIPFNAAELASGTYFYELQSKGYREISRMTIMK